MKTYRRSFVKKALRDANKSSVESRDAVIWHIDSDSSCRVKIQGTDKYITAHFPRNRRARPTWLRVGNAVRVIHRAGVRGYIEVVGQGRAIPQPTLGNALPDPGLTGDGIIEGMVTTATDPPTNSIAISNGSYRINGTIYYYTGTGLGLVDMEDPALMDMGDFPFTKMGISVFLLDAAPSAGYFRYDILVIGTDQTLDYIKGDAVTLDPVIPEVPTSHILIAIILRIGGDTEITMDRIGLTWLPPSASGITVSLDPDFYWDLGDDTPEMDVTVTIIDQYGNAIGMPDSTRILLDKIEGTGQIYSEDTGWNADSVNQVITSSSYTFKYERDQLTSEVKPFFIMTLDDTPALYNFSDEVVLYDINDDPIE